MDGKEYYEYIIVYVENILAVSATPLHIMKEIQEMLNFNNNMIEEPKNYIGARLQKNHINGVDCWSIIIVFYFKAAVYNVEEGIKNKT